MVALGGGEYAGPRGGEYAGPNYTLGGEYRGPRHLAPQQIKRILFSFLVNTGWYPLNVILFYRIWIHNFEWIVFFPAKGAVELQEWKNVLPIKRQGSCPILYFNRIIDSSLYLLDCNFGEIVIVHSNDSA